MKIINNSLRNDFFKSLISSFQLNILRPCKKKKKETCDLLSQVLKC